MTSESFYNCSELLGQYITFGLFAHLVGFILIFGDFCFKSLDSRLEELTYLNTNNGSSSFFASSY